MVEKEMPRGRRRSHKRATGNKRETEAVMARVLGVARGLHGLSQSGSMGTLRGGRFA